MRKWTHSPPLGGRARSYLIVLVAALPAVLQGCAKSGPEKTNNRTIPTEYVEGSFVVSADSSTDANGLKSSSETVASELGCRVAAFDQINWGSSEGTGVLSEEMRNTYSVRFENCDFSKDGTKAILEKFEAQTGVTGAEAEALASVSPIKENDPDKKNQTHLGAIRRDEGCNASERNNKKPVIVAVVDSGVDMDHPDLKDMFLKDRNGSVIGANFVGSGAQMQPDDNWDDGSGHGTHVAGLIGAMANNGKGVVGVGSCANIKIMPVRVLNDEGRGSSLEIERGVKWAAEKGAHIINLSLGYTSVSYQSNPKHYRSLYADLAKRDIVVFAAAGNDGYVNGSRTEDGGRRFHYPSSYNDVISVAATNNSGKLTNFSNRGELVDIAAPGYSVLSTTMDGSYGRMSGTSMATPVAVGSFALALASAEQGFAENVDRIDTQEAFELLQKSVLSNAQLSETEVLSGGMINVEKLVVSTMAKYPKIADEPANNPEEPVDQPIDEPAVNPQNPDDGSTVVPVKPDPQPIETFAFVGLTDGQKAGYPQALQLKNLPNGTYKVYFYWGESYWAFSKVYANGKTDSLKDADEWYLYGNRTLTAVAFNKSGRILKKIKVSLKGY